MGPIPTSAEAGPERRELLGLPPEELRREVGRFLEEREEPSYRLEQVEHWIYEQLALSFEEMTTLPRGLREQMGRRFSLAPIRHASAARSEDGSVTHVWEAEDGERAESVLVPAPERLRLRLSSHAGRAPPRRVPAPGPSDVGRGLAAAEIVAQFRSSALFARREWDRSVTHVSYAGTGEPLANTGALFPSLDVLRDGFGLGARRITVSTAGIVPGIRALARRREPIGLAVSVHAPDPGLRRELVPAGGPHPLPELMAALREYRERSGRRPTIEYALIEGINDGREHAEALADLLSDLACLVSLSPWDPAPDREWESSPPARARAFARALHRLGVSSAVREGDGSRG